MDSNLNTIIYMHQTNDNWETLTTKTKQTYLFFSLMLMRSTYLLHIMIDQVLNFRKGKKSSFDKWFFTWPKSLQWIQN